MTATSRKRAPKLPRVAPDTWPTRRAAGEQLGKSERSVRRLEQSGELVARRDRGGLFRVEPTGLGRVVAKRAEDMADHGPPADAEPSVTEPPARDDPRVAAPAVDGAIAAGVFKMLAAGDSPRDVVVKLALPPETVKLLYGKWVDLGDGLVFEESHLDALCEFEIDVESPGAVVAAVATLARDARAYENLRYPCACGCGQMIQLSVSTLESLIRGGALATWHLVEHADAMRARRLREVNKEAP